MTANLARDSYSEEMMFAGVSISGNDPRMRFRNSKDPIYVAYECIDNQPISTLARVFIKDQVKGFIKFVSKIAQ